MATTISYFAVVALALFGYTHASPRASINGRIVGGKLTDISLIPYQVSLQVGFGSHGFYHHCGGSIISPRFVVTASHCTRNLLSNYQVRTGSSNNKEGGQVYQVLNITNHPSYDAATVDYDVSLLELAEPIVMNDNTQAIEMVEVDEEVMADEVAVVSGWGDTHNSSDDDKLLRSAEVPIFDQETCARLNEEHNTVTDRMICAGYLAGGRDSCQGDSGGPLAVDGRLVGIVSWGVGCAQPNYPGVYTRVSALRGWIRENSDV
jgi:trypsin